jgi:NitT/TauT family transport system substrate-binding protein
MTIRTDHDRRAAGLSRRGLLAALPAGAAALTGLTACGTGSVHLEAGSDGLVPLTLQMDGSAVPYYAPLYLADAKGIFASHGLSVDFVYADASTVLKNVAVGNVELGFPNGDSVIAAVSNEVPVSVIHSTYQRGIGALLFKRAAGIREPADIAGKTIGVNSLGSPNFVQLQVIAAAAGLTADVDFDVRVVGGSAIVEALISDQVDAIMFSRIRYYALRAQGIDIHQILADDYLPSYGNVVVAGNGLLRDYPEVCGSFTAAVNESLAYILEGNFAEAVSVSVERYAPDFAGQEDEIVEVLEDVFATDLWQSEVTAQEGFGAADVEKWQSAADMQERYDLLAEPVAAEDFVVQPSELGEK